MKKVLLLLAIIGTIGVANAQFEVSAGYSNSILTGDEVEDANSLSGMNVGFAYMVDKGSYFFKPGIRLSTEGSKDSESGYEYKLKLPSISVGSLIGTNLSSNFRIYSGLDYKFFTSTKAEYYDADYDESESYDIGSEVKGGTLSVPVGFNVDINERLSFDARYNFGVSNISEERGYDFKINALQVGLAYKL